MRGFWNVLFAFAGISACVSCGGPSSASAPQKLIAVDAAPAPRLPAWIASVSPQSDDVKSLAQLRVIFAKPVAKIEALEGDGPADVLAHVRIEPALQGRFVLLTPRMIAFVADRALPLATRVRVTLTRGLSDLDGDSLSGDLAWSFQTAGVALTGLPQPSPSPGDPTPGPVGLRPTITIHSNVRLDAPSLAAHAKLSSTTGDVALAAVPHPTPGTDADASPEPGATAAEAFDASENDFAYDLQPQTDLAPATTYRLLIAPGVEPAIGNLASTGVFSGAISTYDRLAAVGGSTDPNEMRRFANGDPVIAFNNPLDEKTVAGAISMSPAPSSMKNLTSVNENAVAINPYVLDPRRTYDVTVSTALQDRFGQHLEAPQIITVRTGDFAPGAWIPGGSNVLPAGTPVSVNFYATNLPGGTYRFAVASMTPLQTLVSGDPADVLGNSGRWGERRLNAQPNVQSVVRIALPAARGTFAYGVHTSLSDNDQTGTVQLTNLGLHATLLPQRGMVFAQHLSDGSPAGGAAVTLYRMSDVPGGRTTADRCAAGTTAASGEYALTGIDLERCFTGITSDAPHLGIVVSQGTDVATLQLQSWSGAYAANVDSTWTGGAPRSLGTVFSDRSLYQPGERAQLTGIAYYASPSGRPVADKNASYAVTMKAPDGKDAGVGTVTTDAYGVFSLPYQLSKQQALGYYTVTATGPNGVRLDGSFRVAEFKPPNFKLDVSLSGTSAIAGSTVSGHASAAYLFGAPLQGGKAQATVTRAAAVVAPAGWDDYTFGPKWFWPEREPSVTPEVFQRDLPLDAAGSAQFPIPVSSAIPMPMTYTVSVDATDVSNLSVSDSKTFLALPADAVIGVSCDAVGTAGTPLRLKIVVTDASGKAIAGRAVHVVLQKMTYTSASRSVEGGESADYAVKYDDAGAADVTSGDKPVTVALTPSDASAYRVRATFAGTDVAGAQTDAQVFVAGAGAADFGGEDMTTVPVTLDKASYKVGDMVTAVVASPFDAADAYVAVVRSDVLYKTTVTGIRGAPAIHFRVTPDMLPNAAVQVVLVRRGKPLASVKPGALTSLERTGVAALRVDTSDRYVKLDVVPGRSKAAPGSQQQVAFSVRGSGSARAKIVAVAVNDAVLQLSGYRLPDLVKTVFAEQPVPLRFADNRDNIVLQTQTPPVEKGFGFGGGFLGAAAGTRVRTNFQPLAFYGTAIADENGRASMAFALPDDLTTWRVMAVAIASDDAHFGTADATFLTTQPLLTNPLLPQIVRRGDTFDGGLSMLSTAGGGTADVEAMLSGGVRFISGDAERARATQTLGGSVAALRFPMVAGTPAPSTVRFVTRVNGASDAFSVPLEIRDRGVTESVIDTGASSSAVDIPVSFDRGGSIALTVANSAVPPFVAPALRQLKDDGGIDFAEVDASRLIAVASLQTLAAGHQISAPPWLQPQAGVALKGLLRAQRGNGGFSPWTGGADADPFTTAYALQALAFARAHGVAVPGAPVDAARGFAAQALAHPQRWKWCDAACALRVRFAMLQALAEAGDRRTDFLQSIVDGESQLDSADRIRLARFLLATPGWSQAGMSLANRLRETSYVTGRYTVANEVTSWGWFDSLSQAQAQMLQLLIDVRAPADQIDGAVRALGAQECKCGWPTLPDTAAAMLAILDYSVTQQRPGASSVSVTSGGTPVARAAFSGNGAQAQTVTVDAARVSAPSLHIAPSGGTVHYTIVYTYPVAKDAPGTLTAFRVTRELRAAGSDAVLSTIDLARLTGPVTVDAGRVFDVGVRIAVDHPVNNIVIDDPLPAGFEAVDASFATANPQLGDRSSSWQIDSQQIYADRVTAFASQLQPGVYELHYLVRSVTPGTYRWPGASASLLNAPEQFGRTAAAQLTVR